MRRAARQKQEYNRDVRSYTSNSVVNLKPRDTLRATLRENMRKKVDEREDEERDRRHVCDIEPEEYLIKHEIVQANDEKQTGGDGEIESGRRLKLKAAIRNGIFANADLVENKSKVPITQLDRAKLAKSRECRG